MDIVSKGRERRKRGPMGLGVFLAAIIVFFGAALATGRPGAPELYPAGSDAVTVYILDNGFHTDLVIPTDRLAAHGGALASAAAQATDMPWAAIGWGLQPLQNMARVIRGRHAESLEPLQLVPLPKELEPMQAAINRLLAQIDELLRREHRFIADAAHEMRTPLAILRLHAQNAQAATSAVERDKALEFLIGARRG